MFNILKSQHWLHDPFSTDKINQQVPSVKIIIVCLKATVGNLKNNPICKRMKQYKCTKLRKDTREKSKH